MHTVSAQSRNFSLPKRPADGHKSTFGNVCILGGDTGMLGAPLLAARAALHMGAGRTYLSFIAPDAPQVDVTQPEIMCRPLATVHELQLDALVIGPGLGQSPEAQHQLAYWLESSTPLVLDADALNLIAKIISLQQKVRERKAPTILTPHPAEAARLLHTDTAHIQSDRVSAASALAQQYQSVIALKGAGTIMTAPDTPCTVNTTGNVALATGGTGDVLSGVIGALLAQKLPALAAVQLGVYLHGAAADALVAKGIGPAGLTASELIPEIRSQFNQLYTTSSCTP